MGDQVDLPFDQHEEVQQRKSAKKEPTNRVAGRGDRGDKEVDVEVNTRGCQQGEVE
jgi:hypothetical protein